MYQMSTMHLVLIAIFCLEIRENFLFYYTKRLCCKVSFVSFIQVNHLKCKGRPYSTLVQRCYNHFLHRELKSVISVTISKCQFIATGYFICLSISQLVNNLFTLTSFKLYKLFQNKGTNLFYSILSYLKNT